MCGLHGCGELPQAQVRRAVQAANRGNLEQAESLLRRALEREPQLADAHLYLGELYLRQERFQESRDAYRALVDLRPFHGVGHLNLALLGLHFDDLDDAVRSLLLAQQYGDDKVASEVEALQVALGRARILRDQLDDLLARLASRPDDSDLLRETLDARLARTVNLQTVNLEQAAATAMRQARETCEQLVARLEEQAHAQPRSATLTLALGVARADMAWMDDGLGDGQAAQASQAAANQVLGELARDAAAAPSQRARAWYALARLALLQDDAATALDCMEHAATDDPSDAELQIALAEALYRAGRGVEAMVAPLRRAAMLSPTTARHHVMLGNVLHAAGDNTGARAAYDDALKHAMHPSDVAAARDGLTALDQGAPPAAWPSGDPADDQAPGASW